MSLLISGVLLDGKKQNIYVEDNRITKVGGRKKDADTIIDGKSLAAVPGFVNTHTHLAMTLLRGYADDMELQPWLEKKIWPREAKLTPEFIKWGSKMGVLEMIKTGTTTFVDMYFNEAVVGKVVKDMGIRGVLSEGYLDMFDAEKGEFFKKNVEKNVEGIRKLNCDRVIPSVGPHSIYTASGGGFKWCWDFARENRLVVHYHLSETQFEVDECKKANGGVRPVKYLQKLGVLGKRSVAAHGVFLTSAELGMLAKHGVSISTNPQSNQKIGVGGMFPFKDCLEKKVNLTIGTDGPASNNNLDMLEAMKFAALQAKVMGTPTVMNAPTTLKCATANGARALGIDAGVIKEGKLADIVLLDLKSVRMVPNHNFVSNVVYSANGGDVKYTICDGKVLMRDGKVEGEEKIIKGFAGAAQRFVKA